MGPSSATDLTIFPSADVEHFLSLIRRSKREHREDGYPWTADWNRYLKNGYKLGYEFQPVLRCLGLFYCNHEFAVFWRCYDPQLTQEQLSVFENPALVAYCLELYMLEMQMAKV